MEKFPNPATLTVGQLVDYIWSDKPHKLLATKDQPHIYNWGIKGFDPSKSTLPTERPVPNGFDYTIIEVASDFRPYIDIKKGDLR